MQKLRCSRDRHVPLFPIDEEFIAQTSILRPWVFLRIFLRLKYMEIVYLALLGMHKFVTR